MEDSHIAVIGLKETHVTSNFDKDETGLFAVFDGHGGKEVALFAEENFEDWYEDALRRTFHKIDELLHDTVRNNKPKIRFFAL